MENNYRQKKIDSIPKEMVKPNTILHHIFLVQKIYDSIPKDVRGKEREKRRAALLELRKLNTELRESKANIKGTGGKKTSFLQIIKKIRKFSPKRAFKSIITNLVEGLHASKELYRTRKSSRRIKERHDYGNFKVQ